MLHRHKRSAYFFSFTSWKSATGRFLTRNCLQGVGGKKTGWSSLSLVALDLWSPPEMPWPDANDAPKPSHTGALNAVDSFVMAWFPNRLLLASKPPSPKRLLRRLTMLSRFSIRLDRLLPLLLLPPPEQPPNPRRRYERRRDRPSAKI